MAQSTATGSAQPNAEEIQSTMGSIKKMLMVGGLFAAVG